VAIPASALEEAVALLTVAMHAGGSELDELVEEFEAKDRSSELLHATVALCRSLCFTTARLVHALDDQLTNEEAMDLTDAHVRAAALEVVRAYGRSLARGGEVPTG
jgi:hypothetical protein